MKNLQRAPAGADLPGTQRPALMYSRAPLANGYWEPKSEEKNVWSPTSEENITTLSAQTAERMGHAP
jgi:hypothetical protein